MHDGFSVADDKTNDMFFTRKLSEDGTQLVVVSEWSREDENVNTAIHNYLSFRRLQSTVTS